MIAKVFLILILLFIFFQDVKFRAVYWFLFPVVLGLSYWIGIETSSIENMGWNLGFFLFLMAFLTLYLSLKQGTVINIANGYFSWGDMFFLLAIIPLFPFSLYVLFFTAGTLFTLVVHGISSLVSRKTSTVPFAGYMSLFLVVFILFRTHIHQLILLCS